MEMSQVCLLSVLSWACRHRACYSSNNQPAYSCKFCRRIGCCKVDTTRVSRGFLHLTVMHQKPLRQMLRSGKVLDVFLRVFFFFFSPGNFCLFCVEFIIHRTLELNFLGRGENHQPVDLKPNILSS